MKVIMEFSGYCELPPNTKFCHEESACIITAEDYMRLSPNERDEYYMLTPFTDVVVYSDILELNFVMVKNAH